MKGIVNFLYFVNENWTSILVCVGIIVGIIQKTRTFIKKTDDEKIESAKTQIKEIVLRMITEAEVDFDDWDKAGSIKRSQVIEEIFMNYPILSKVVDQKELIAWIDKEIDGALGVLEDVVNKNKNKENE